MIDDVELVARRRAPNGAATMPPSEITATSLVPPPISTTMLPVASATGRPAPMAAAIGSSMIDTCLAPALMRGLLHGAALHRRDAGGDADDNARPGEDRVAERLAG